MNVIQQRLAQYDKEIADTKARIRKAEEILLDPVIQKFEPMKKDLTREEIVDLRAQTHQLLVGRSTLEAQLGVAGLS